MVQRQYIEYFYFYLFVLNFFLVPAVEYSREKIEMSTERIQLLKVKEEETMEVCRLNIVDSFFNIELQLARE
jgi:hypothetical protein